MDGVLHLLDAGVGEALVFLPELHVPGLLVGRNCASPGFQVQAEHPLAFIGIIGDH